MSDKPRGAERQIKELDFLLEMDEPEQFVQAAINATVDRPRWAEIHAALVALEKDLAIKNEPVPKLDDPQP